jgi:hypothetical protein
MLDPELAYILADNVRGWHGRKIMLTPSESCWSTTEPGNFSDILFALQMIDTVSIVVELLRTRDRIPAFSTE